MKNVEQKPITSYAHLYQVFKKHGVLHEQIAYVPPAINELGPTILKTIEVCGSTGTGQGIQDRSELLKNPGYRGYTALETAFFQHMYEVCELHELVKNVGLRKVLGLLAKDPFNKNLQHDIIRYILVELYKYRMDNIEDTTCFIPMDLFALLMAHKDVFGCIIDDERVVFIGIKQSFEHIRILFADVEKKVADVSKYASKQSLGDGITLYRFNNKHQIFDLWEKTYFNRTYMEMFPIPNVVRYYTDSEEVDDCFIYIFDPQRFTIFTQPMTDFDADISWTVITTKPGIFLL